MLPIIISPCYICPMKKSGIVVSIVVFLLLVSCDAIRRTGTDLTKPNIIVIFIDDMGYGDLGCYGASGYATPNIDKLATEGMKFTDFYAPQGVCSASRAGLLTGCYPNRIGITGALSPNAKHGINEEEETIAEILKPEGYSTAIFGKWHLGHHERFLPLQHGFDEYFGLPYSNDMWPVNYDGKPFTTGWKSVYPALPLIDGNQVVDTIGTLNDQDQLTTLYTEKAVDFIRRNKDNPFFLYLPHSMVHVPLGVSDRFRGKSKQGLFGDVMMELDWSVGEITQALDELGLTENTLIIFTSDNGPWLNYGNHAGSTGGFREGKGTSWEGGQRVPCIVKWPAVVTAGTVSDKLASALDILPTIASITDADLSGNIIDGFNMLPLLEGDTSSDPRSTFFFYYNRNDLEAIRHGDWKLIFPHKFRSYKGMVPGMDGWPGPYACGESELELYNLKDDPHEHANLVDAFPKIVDKLNRIADSARLDIGDDLTKTIGDNTRPPGYIYNLQKSTEHIAMGAVVNYNSEFSVKYTGGGKGALCDGKLAAPDIKHPAWQGFEGNDLSIVLDLGESKPISEICLRMQKEEGGWVFLAEQVKIETSVNGQDFQDLAIIDKGAYVPVIDEMIYKACWNSLPHDMRFVRISAQNQGVCPEGHPGAGGKAWLFVDEVIVR